MQRGRPRGRIDNARVRCYFIGPIGIGGVAQVVEQGSHNPRVGSSSLPAATSSPSSQRDSAFAAAFEATVLRVLRGDGGVAEAAPTVVALSGGPDSAALFEAVRRIRSAAGVAAGDLVAAHFNHRLRGVASDRDALFASALARAAGVPCVVGEPAAPLVDDASNLEAGARAARYAFLHQVADAAGASAICVAHTRDDQAETVLMRLARGAGARSLAAMAPRRADGVVRPLLDVPRSEVARYRRVRAIPAVRDGSNDDTTRTRSRVRHLLLPEMKRLLGVDVGGRLARLASELRVEAELADRALAAILGGPPCPQSLAIATLREAGPAAGRLLHAWLSGGARAISARQVGAILAIAAADRPSARVDLGGGLRVERRYEQLLLVQGGAQECAPWQPVELPVPGAAEVAGRWRIAAAWTRVGGGASEAPAVALPRDPGAVLRTDGWFDASLLRLDLSPGGIGLPLRVRRAGPGDRVSARAGHRKLSDVLIDARVPRAERGGLAVVVAADDTVLWVPGVACPPARPSGREVRLSLFAQPIRAPGRVGPG